jgi:hypothetical protein
MKKFFLIFLFLGISLFSLFADNDESYRPQLFYSTDQDIIAFADVRGNIIEYNAVTMAEKVYNNPLTLTNERLSHPRVTIDCDNKVSIVMTDQGLSAWYYTTGTGTVKPLPEIPINKIRDICFSPTGKIVYFLVQFAGLVEYDLEAMQKTVTDLSHKIELCFYSFNSLPYIGVSWCDPGGGGEVDFYSLPSIKPTYQDWEHSISGGERHSSKISRSDLFVANNSYNRFFEVYKTVPSDSKIEFNKILRRRSYKIYSFSPDENYIAVLKDPNTIGIIDLHKPDEKMAELKYGETEILDFGWTVNNTFVCLNTDFELEVVDIPLF